MKLLFLLLVFAFPIAKLNGLKILTIAPFYAKSHFAIGHSIAKTLLDAGHEITMLSPYPLKNPYKNYTDISIAKTIDKLEEDEDMNIFEFRDMPMFVFIPFLYYMSADLVEAIMVDNEVTKFMNSKVKYDVCIFEAFTIDALLVLPFVYCTSPTNQFRPQCKLSGKNFSIPTFSKITREKILHSNASFP